jgi:hypothetical protein
MRASAVWLRPNRVMVIAGLGILLAPAVQPGARAQRGGVAPVASTAVSSSAGLDWRFVRVKYHYLTEDVTRREKDFAGEPWYIDAPAAEDNLSRRMKAVTAIRVDDPIVIALDDPRLFTYPWVYFVEPGNLHMKEPDVALLREFLLRGGTAMFDDFHGPIEWENLAGELKRVFPERPIVEIPKGHAVFSSFYEIDAYPQIAGIGSFLAGRSWEKGGFVPHLRTILDDDGRPMEFINWNTDMGDGWEWSNASDYPGYVKYTADSYRMTINEIVYALTH